MLQRRMHVISTRRHCLHLGKRTAIMGILNLTPDSFSGDGQLKASGGREIALHRAMRMVRDGADILDIGGESTRPGAKVVSWKEEVRRVIPTITQLVKKVSVPVSIDTYKPEVVHAALDAGASIVNVIKGTPVNSKIIKLVRQYDAAIVLMHMRGTPQTMQTKVKYKDLINDIVSELKKSVEKCLEIGIKEDDIIVDPGIGFAKTVEQNLKIIHNLNNFKVLNCPILVGPSRKSFIGKTLDLDVKDRLIGTAAATAVCIMNGAHIVRVHDVLEMKQVAMMADAILAVN